MDDHTPGGRSPHTQKRGADLKTRNRTPAPNRARPMEAPRPEWPADVRSLLPVPRHPSVEALRARAFAEERPRGVLAETYLDGWCVNHVTGSALQQMTAAFQSVRFSEGLNRALRPFVPLEGDRAQLVRDFLAGDGEARRTVAAFIPLDALSGAVCAEVFAANIPELEVIARAERQAFRRRDQDLQQYLRLQERPLERERGEE